MVAALLARQVGPSIVESVLDALREQGLLDPVHLDLAAAPELLDALRDKIRSISVRTLAPPKQLAHWLVEQHDGRAEDVTDWGGRPTTSATSSPASGALARSAPTLSCSAP